MRNPLILVLTLLLAGALAVPTLAVAEDTVKPAATEAAKAKADAKAAKAAKAAEAKAAKAAKAAEAKAAKAAAATAAKTAPATAEAKPAETKPADKPAETKPAEAKPGNDAGKELFVANACNKCHRVTAAGIKPLKEKADIVDLSGVGAEHDAAWFKKWLKKEIDKDSELKPGEKVKHKASWKGSDADLDVMTGWLKGLSKK